MAYQITWIPRTGDKNLATDTRMARLIRFASIYTFTSPEPRRMPAVMALNPKKEKKIPTKRKYAVPVSKATGDCTGSTNEETMGRYRSWEASARTIPKEIMIW